MTQCRAVHDKNNPYLTINTTIATDDRISWKAKGIWFYAFSKRDDWVFYFKDLEKRSTDGRESLRAGLKELEKAGYLERKATRGERGKMTGQEWIFYETPRKIETIDDDLPKDGKPAIRETSQADNRPLITNEYKQVIKEELLPRATSESPKKSVVVVPSLCLQLGADEDSYRRLLKLFPEEKIIAACKLAVEQGTKPEIFFGWVRDCIQKGYKPKPSKESNVAENRKWARETFARRNLPNVNIEALNQTLEFVYLGSSKPPDVFDYSMQAFKEVVGEHYRRLQELIRSG